MKLLKTREDNCSGCRLCEMICAMENYREVNPSLAALMVEGKFPAPGSYEIRACNQCGVCEGVCPVNAIYDQNGVYLVDEELCTGCEECVVACPRDVIFIKGDIAYKCNLCGLCTEYCPREALYREEDSNDAS